MAFPQLDDVQLDMTRWGAGLGGVLDIGTHTDAGLTTINIGDNTKTITMTLRGPNSKFVAPVIDYDTLTVTGTEATSVTTDNLIVNNEATLTIDPGKSLLVQALATPTETLKVDGTSGDVLLLGGAWTFDYDGDTTTSKNLSLTGTAALEIGGNATVRGGKLILDNLTENRITSTTTASIIIDKRVDAIAGLDVSGGALNVTDQNITHSGTGTITFAGAVEANGGLTVNNAALTVNQAITQTGTANLVQFEGNVDAKNGLDVTNGALTVNGFNIAKEDGSPDSVLEEYEAAADQTEFLLANPPRNHAGNETAATAYGKSNLTAYVNGQRVTNFKMDPYGQTVIFDTGLQAGAKVVFEYLR